MTQVKNGEVLPSAYFTTPRCFWVDSQISSQNRTYNTTHKTQKEKERISWCDIKIRVGTQLQRAFQLGMHIAQCILHNKIHLHALSMEVVMFLEALSNILEDNPLSEGISHFPPVTVKASGFQRDKHSAIWA